MQKVMNQSPRLRIKERTLPVLVILRRVVINRQERFERQQLFSGEQPQMLRVLLSERQFSAAVRDFESAVIFRQTFV